MVSKITPTGPSSPSGDSPDVTAAAQSFGKALDTAIAELSNLNPKNLEPQLPKLAQLFIDLNAIAQKALKAAGR